MIQELGNLQTSIARMKEYYDKGRHVESFQESDMVYLKLRPIDQQTLSQKPLCKLESQFYGSFQVEGRI